MPVVLKSLPSMVWKPRASSLPFKSPWIFYKAVDAAIAANAILGLTEPTGSGIGGDIFALVWDAAQKKLFGLNGSGRSPKSLSLAELQKRGLKKIRR